MGSILIARQDAEEHRPRLSDPAERARLLAYLDEGRLLDAGGGARTDGAWIWTEADLRHLRDPGLCPDPELCRHAAARQYAFPSLDEVVVERASRAWQAALRVRPARPVVTRTETGTLTVAGGLTSQEQAILDEMLGRAERGD
ncbi:hypothetical protein ACTMTI_01325 [Nonomuraea sp. H19]|uniref:hypothetical protein n=1 Tax=Nonomuraea sp. H19 TaxID=3452206 RepID=UPI003F8CB4D2